MDNDPSKLLDHTSEASAKSAAEPPLSPSREVPAAILLTRPWRAVQVGTKGHAPYFDRPVYEVHAWNDGVIAGPFDSADAKVYATAIALVPEMVALIQLIASTLRETPETEGDFARALLARLK